MRIAVTTLLAALLLGVGTAACGGDDDEDTDTTPAAEATAPADTTPAAEATQPADTAPAGGAAPDAVLSCLEDAGLSATSQPGDDALGVVGQVQVDVGPQNRIIVDFFEDPADAKDYSEGQATFLGPSGGSSEVLADTVVVGVARPGAEEELSTVEGCVGS